MDGIIYQYIDDKSKEFDQVMELRYSILFQPYKKIGRYDYDELDDKSFHLVALNDSMVIGYSRLTYIDGKGKITNVVVHPDFISLGIGHCLIRNLINKAKEEAISEIFLNSRLDVTEFYRKLGFVPQGNSFVSDKSGLLLQKMVLRVNHIMNI